MNQPARKVDPDVLAQLVPLNVLSRAQLEQLAVEARVHSVGPGTTIFRQGQRDEQTIYLLNGEVTLAADGRVAQTVHAGTEQAHYAIAHLQPRRFTAKTRAQSTLLMFDSKLLDHHLTLNQSQSIEVADIGAEDDDEDWMTKMLQSQLFVQIPPANIQQMLMRMQQINVHQGDRVINQGDEGDYYYIIKRGTCAVMRRTEDGKSEEKLAELGSGASFGEEALVSDKKRNASIVMLSEGVLMRLGKADFVELVRKPMLHQMKFDAAQELVDGGAIWLDVRSEAEFQNGRLPGSINIPLTRLRTATSELDSSKGYIAYCDTGSRGAVAAFLLTERGLDAHFLDKGLGGLPDGVQLESDTGAVQQPEPAEAVELLDSEGMEPADEPESVALVVKVAANPEPPTSAPHKYSYEELVGYIKKLQLQMKQFQLEIVKLRKENQALRSRLAGSPAKKTKAETG